MIDYRALLGKYIQFVTEYEGTDFLYYADEEPGLSDEEVTELRTISQEVNER